MTRCPLLTQSGNERLGIAAVAAFARTASGGLIVVGSPFTAIHRDLIIALAARYKLPAVFFAKDGGLIAYGFR